MKLEPTFDPNTWIEEKRDGYTRYRNSDGRRWEVFGYCDRRGDCMIGSVIDTPDGPVQIKDHEHLAQLCHELNRERIEGTYWDVPISPEYDGNCCPFTVKELDPVPTEERNEL